MPPNTLVVRSTRVVTPDGIRRAAVVVAGRRIAGVASYDYRAAGPAADVDLGDLALLPGLVDTHVHVNEPGLAESEGFGTATSAAAAGGITTICDMPLNSVPVTTSLDALRAKLAAARGRCRVDVAFWGGAVPGNLGRLGPLAQAGVAGFKCFLSPTSTTAFPPLGAAALKAAMAEVAATGTPLLVHAEDPRELRPPKDGSYGGFLASRPPVAERRAIEAVVTAAAATGARAHIVHLAAADCAPLIAAAKTAGVNLTVETCPHYLVFAAEDIPDGATEFKCCPPVRSAANREALWRALAEGVIDCVVSDHSPCLPELKRGDFATAWGGIASLQVTLPAVWTAAHSRGFTLTDIARWMSAAPARLAGLSRKGAIAAGRDADLVAFDPDAPLVVDGTRLRHRHPVTPYHGKPLTGVVTRVWLRGREILPGDSPHGSLLFPRVRGLSG